MIIWLNPSWMEKLLIKSERVEEKQFLIGRPTVVITFLTYPSSLSLNQRPFPLFHSLQENNIIWIWEETFERALQAVVTYATVLHFFRSFEKKINHDRKEIVKHLNTCHGKLEHRLLHLEKKTQDQITQLTHSMKEGFDQERVECNDRLERRSIRDRLLQDRHIDARDDIIKGDLSNWLDNKVSETFCGEKSEDKGIEVLARGAIRGSKRRRKDLISEIASGSLRRAVSQDDLLEEEGNELGDDGRGVLGQVPRASSSNTPTNQIMMISYDDDASTYVVRKSPALPPRRPPPYRPPPHQMPPIKENGLSVLPARLWPNSSPLTLSNGTNSEGGDSHNDSGYYTRTGVASSGPSPSLSGSRPQSRALLDICSYSSSSSSQSIAPKIRDLQLQLARTNLDALPQGSLV
ncbi:uncharacterized protein [Lepeophtheirus salmonis]|uniref:uncharacterized protein isoform X1 n=1 Tax=Lepeophtheirus salmonis TaxID=72036 RepID=UPI003AF3EE58